MTFSFFIRSLTGMFGKENMEKFLDSLSNDK